MGQSMSGELHRQGCVNCVKKVKWYEGERRKPWAQGALACTAGRSKEMRRSRRMKTLIARRSWISERKSWLYNCEESLGSQICRKVWETCSKKNVSRREIKQRRNHLLPEHQKT